MRPSRRFGEETEADKLINGLVERLTLARKYKQMLVSALSDIDEELFLQAMDKAWGRYHGRIIKNLCKKTVRLYFQSLKEKMGLEG